MAQKILFLLLIGLLIQCNVEAQHKTTIKGEGKVVTQEITLDPFHGINLSFHGDVVLTQGATQQVIIEGQQNIIDNIKREVQNGNWNIEFDHNVKDAEPVKVTITVPNLDEIGLCGSGAITSTNRFMDLHKLEINISGSGNIHFDYEGKSTELNLSGSGKAELAGESSELEINISGSGGVKAKELLTSDCDVSISGSGNASVYVNGDLEAQVSGSGEITYTGNANVDAIISGSGKVNKM